MKKIIIIPILIFMIGIVFNSCKKEVFDPVLENTAIPAFTAPASGGSYVLTDAIADSTFETFIWSPADFNVDIEISYILEVDLAANNFSKPITVAIQNEDTFEITVFNFNKILTTQMGLTPGIAANLAFRIGTPAEADSLSRTYSETITMAVTPYDPPFAPDQLFVISNAATIGKLLPTDANGNYEGYAWIAAADLSFTLSDLETGGIILGDNEDDGVAEIDGSAIASAMFQAVDESFTKGSITEGYYKININSYDLTYQVVETSWAVIGSAMPNGWSDPDENMTYDQVEGVWTATITAIDGEFKFRPNDTWNPLNYGDDDLDGVPDEYGANIPITAGDYTFILDLREYPYTYSFTAVK